MADSQAQPQKKEKSTVKRDFLRKIEIDIQKKWQDEKIFEEDAPESNNQEKFLVTFPYPYMNGRLHLGHTFTLTKAEFTANYQRLKGKKVLFPFGFHCTGMPIKACADKLKREIELYGNPPNFPAPAPEPEEEPAANKEAPQSKAKADPLAFHAQKSKVKAKSGGATYQWNIMKSNGVPESEIAKFADASYWLEYFPPLAKADMNKMGLGVDWRRSFITTDVNPYYDSFVRWQFETLRDKNKVQFGKRFTIYSPKDGQPCADHDRQTGEGVLPQEYTLIKLEVVKPFPEKLKHLESSGKRVFLVPGTLRPETMYGQTNCWVLPEGAYGAFEVNDTDVFICTARAARNLAFQNQSKQFGVVNCLAELKGWDILGIPLKAPLSFYPVIYTLPMLTISPTKGTGIVTSVPSDAPDDYINLEELKRKPQWRAKFNIKDEMVMPYDIVPIINVPDFGDKAAVTACEKLKIKSPNDKELLAQAKDDVYLNGFNKGVMLVGEHKGKPVKEAKPLIKEAMIANNEALVYSEPADLVMSRSGDECVVCLTDQWFLDYGEDHWRSQIDKHLKTMVNYSDDTMFKMKIALDWMNQWACSRTYGLGSRLPWDPQYLIESLSDSTIYMAYYAVAYWLQNGVLDGHEMGPAQIKPELLTRQVWDYIFLRGPYPANCGIPESTLQKLRHEFEYWYPVDIRVSGKDLINNHLIFMLYNHAAIWDDPSKWPRGIRCNGHVLLNNEKMSKSLGNFFTLTDAVDEFSADGMRFALADAGDSLEDSNFATATADTAILRLFTQIEWIQETLANKDKLRSGPPTSFMDRVFESLIAKAIVETDKHYQKTSFREALKTGFFDLQTHRDNYRTSVGSEGMNGELILRFIEVQALLMAPITPHWSEYVWQLLGKSSSVRKASWPAVGTLDEVLLKQHDYLQQLVHSLRIKKDLFAKKKGGKPEDAVPTKLVIHVAKSYPEWMEKTVKVVRPLFETAVQNKTALDDKEVAKAIGTDASLKPLMKKVMPYMIELKRDVETKGLSALDLKLPFDEKQLLHGNADYIKTAILVKDMEIKDAEDDAAQKSTPGNPFTTFH